MKSSIEVNHRGLSLRLAALIAGITYLTNPVSYAEFSIFPRLVTERIDQTVENLTAHPLLFGGAILCYLINGMGDIVMAWAMYHLLAPVSRSLSLLAAWFQVVYAGMALCSVFNLVAVHQLLRSPEYLTTFTPTQLHAQILSLLETFHSEWDFALVLFGIHLVVIGYLIVRCSYIPRWLGAVLIVDGLGWVVNSVGPYVGPRAAIWRFTFVTACGEILFMLWLLIRGWKIRESRVESGVAAA